MFELTYTSFANSDLSRKDILEIERISNINNSINDITGCLVCHNNEFIEIIEGCELAVKNLYSKIRRDQRHRGISLLSSGAIVERQFKDWRMICHKFHFQENKRFDFSLFEENLKSLSHLTESQTRGSRVFWNCVAALTDIRNGQYK